MANLLLWMIALGVRASKRADHSILGLENALVAGLF